MLKYLLLLTPLFFTACFDDKPTQEYDGKLLLSQKCASCHNLDMPPITSADEKAPPIMAVAFHVHSLIKPSDESQRTPKAIEFVADYVRAPSMEKSFCDKESLASYGVMPSQKEKVTEDEAKAIATYMFHHYTQENFLEIMDAKMKFAALPAGEKIAFKYKCLTCHKIDKDTVGPSFLHVKEKYQNSQKLLQESIKNGSQGKWERIKAIMPAFKQASDKELSILAEWILALHVSKP